MKTNTLTNHFLNLCSYSQKQITIISDKNHFSHISYVQLLQESMFILRNLQSQGLNSGSELVIQTNNIKSFITTFWACILGRIIAIPISPMKSEDIKRKLLNIWKILDHPKIVTDDEIILKNIDENDCIHFDDLMDDRGPGKILSAEPDDLAYVQFSSGSTGDPKGVMLTHNNIVTNIFDICDLLNIYPNSEHKCLSWLPLTHDLGLIGCHLFSLVCNLDQVIMLPEIFLRHPQNWLYFMWKFNATFSESPNFGFQYVVDHFQNHHYKNIDLSHVHMLLTAAEPISIELCEVFQNKFKCYGLKTGVITPAYGLAEASVGVSSKKPGELLSYYSIKRNFTRIGEQVVYSKRGESNSITCLDVGTSCTHCQIRIVDNQRNILNEDRIGRIQIKGENVTHGYYNNKKATKEIITPDGWLDTGDLGFQHKNAFIITGRIKDIIFVNGQNYYPHDLENIVYETNILNSGKIAIVGSFNYSEGIENIIAFIVYKGNINRFPELASICRKTISEKTGIGINCFIPIRKIPKTTSGKIKRYVLFEKYLAGDFNDCLFQLDKKIKSKKHHPPRNRKEEVLLAAWHNVLKHKSINIYDNYFELGGDSVKAILILTEIQKMGYTIKQDIIYKAPTVAEAAKYMEKNISLQNPIDQIKNELSEKENISHEDITEIQDIYTLTPMQEGMFYFSKLDLHSNVYFQQFSFTAPSNWNEKILKESSQKLIDRHDVLRTVFVENLTDRLLQVVFKKREPAFHFEDISHLDEKSQRQFIENYKLNDMNRTFNLNRDMLFRLAVFKLSRQSAAFYGSFHHILLDGWCASIIFRDFFEIYSSIKENRPLQLPPIDAYRNYIQWLEMQDKEISLTYWKNYLSNYSSLSSFPKIKDVLSSHENDERVLNLIEVSESDHQRIKNLTKQMKTTVNVFIRTVWGILLANYSGKNDVVFGAVTSGRPAEVTGIANMIGLFINTNPVRIQFNHSESFSEALIRVQQEAIQSTKHQYSSLAQIQSMSLIKGELFDHILTFQNIPIFSEYEGQERQYGSSKIHTQISNLDINGITNYNLDIEILQKNEIIIKVMYNPKMYDHDVIKRIENHLLILIKLVLDDPKIALNKIDFLTQQEKEQQLTVFNQFFKNRYAETNIHTLFEAQAAKTPQISAISQNDISLDYETLNASANQLAHFLRKKGVMPDNIVGIYLDRSIEAIVAVLAVWKAGGAYLPLNTSQPVQRTVSVIQNSQITHLITHKNNITSINFAGRVIQIDDPEIKNLSDQNLKSVTHPQNLCYAISTSGSTGKPKSVMMRHHEITSLISALNEKLMISQCPFNLLQIANFAFDVFLEDMCRSLIFGGQLVICPETIRIDPAALYQFILDNEINFFEITPALANPLFDYVIENNLKFPMLKVVIIGADVLLMDDYRKIRQYLPESIRLINSYGVSECAIDSSWFEESADYPYQRITTPIGKPLPNNRLYILDKFQKMLPVGASGELYISADSVGLGYLGDPYLTAEKFIDDPFIKGGRMYRTGDNARWLNDGNMEFLGRQDFQIKIRGNRVELGDIERQMLSFSEISEVVAVMRDIEKKKGIVAYYTSKNKIENEVLKLHLLERLPEYMIPSIMVQLDEMPLNQNGKIDRNALMNIAIGNKSEKKSTDENITPIEAILLDVWKQFLGKDIGIHDDFFAIGGDSIISIQIQSELRKQGYQYDLQNIFKYSNIASLAPKVEPIQKKIEQGPIYGKSLLMPIQTHFFELQKTDPHHYNHSIALYFKNGFKQEFMIQVFTHLITHHDALKMVFKKVDGVYIQEIPEEDKAVDISFYKIQATSHDNPAFLEKINELQTSLDLENGPIYRIAHFQCKDGDRLVIIIHHLVVDGISWRIILKDIQTLFKQISENQNLKLPAKTNAFIHWAEKLNQFANKQPILRQKDFWKRIEQSAISELPFDKSGKPCCYKYLKSLSSSLDTTLTHAILSDIHDKYNTTTEDILLTGVAIAMYHTFNMDSIPIALENHGRESIIKNICIDRTVGWFTSYYPVILNGSQSNDIELTIKIIKESIHQIPDNGIGYEILKYLTPKELKQDMRFSLKPPIEFNYLGQFGNLQSSESDMEILGILGEPISENGEIGVDIIISISVKDDKFYIQVDFNQTRFFDSTLERFIKNLQKALNDIVNHCRSKTESTLTPSDFSGEDLSVEELEEINALVDEI